VVEVETLRDVSNHELIDPPVREHHLLGGGDVEVSVPPADGPRPVPATVVRTADHHLDAPEERFLVRSADPTVGTTWNLLRLEPGFAQR
jgi:hypothetical protein